MWHTAYTTHRPYQYTSVFCVSYDIRGALGPYCPFKAGTSTTGKRKREHKPDTCDLPLKRLQPSETWEQRRCSIWAPCNKGTGSSSVMLLTVGLVTFALLVKSLELGQILPGHQIACLAFCLFFSHIVDWFFHYNKACFCCFQIIALSGFGFFIFHKFIQVVFPYFGWSSCSPLSLCRAAFLAHLCLGFVWLFGELDAIECSSVSRPSL